MLVFELVGILTGLSMFTRGVGLLNIKQAYPIWFLPPRTLEEVLGSSLGLNLFLQPLMGHKRRPNNASTWSSYSLNSSIAQLCGYLAQKLFLQDGQVELVPPCVYVLNSN